MNDGHDPSPMFFQREFKNNLLQVRNEFQLLDYFEFLSSDQRPEVI